MGEWLEWIWDVLVIIIVTKHLMGIEFPWHTCRCCGKKFSEHEKGTTHESCTSS